MRHWYPRIPPVLLTGRMHQLLTAPLPHILASMSQQHTHLRGIGGMLRLLDFNKTADGFIQAAKTEQLRSGIWEQAGLSAIMSIATRQQWTKRFFIQIKYTRIVYNRVVLFRVNSYPATKTEASKSGILLRINAHMNLFPRKMSPFGPLPSRMMGHFSLPRIVKVLSLSGSSWTGTTCPSCSLWPKLRRMIDISPG